MIVYMARYVRNPNRHHRLVVEMSNENYQTLCDYWNIERGALRVTFRAGEKGVYLSHARGSEGYLISRAKEDRPRWRIEFRSDTYQAISKLPVFGTSECNAVVESNGSQKPILRIDMPLCPKPARPYHPRKHGSQAAPPPAVVAGADTKFAAKLFVGDEEYNLSLTLSEVLGLVSQHSA